MDASVLWLYVYRALAMVGLHGLPSGLDLTILFDDLSFLKLGLLIDWSVLERDFNLSKASNLSNY